MYSYRLRNLVLIISLLIIGCKSDMKNDNINLELVLVNSLKLKGNITINNTSETEIIINRFVYETATLILEVQEINDKGNISIPLPAPPTPPSDLNAYEVNLKPKQEFQTDIKGLDIISNTMRQKTLRIRVKGFYKLSKDNVSHKIMSNWVELKPIKK